MLIYFLTFLFLCGSVVGDIACHSTLLFLQLSLNNTFYLTEDLKRFLLTVRLKTFYVIFNICSSTFILRCFSIDQVSRFIRNIPPYLGQININLKIDHTIDDRSASHSYIYKEGVKKYRY